MLILAFEVIVVLPDIHTFVIIRGKVSREFHTYSRGMLNLAYIGANILNFCPITGFVYFCFKINKAWYWSKIQICGANVG